jgi:hypothetical protein
MTTKANTSTPKVKGKAKVSVSGASAVDMSVTAEVKLAPHDPIPLELGNIFGYSPGGNKFIPFFEGTDKVYGFNAFFVNILQSAQQSPTQAACITQKTKYTIGDGLYIDGPGEKDKSWQAFKACANGDGKGLNAVLKEIIASYFTFGNVCVEFVKGSFGGKKFLYVYVKNTLDCRKAWPDENNCSNAVIISRWFRKPGVYNLTEKFNIRIPFYRCGPGNKNMYWMEDAIAVTNPDKEANIYGGETPRGGIGVYRTSLWIKDDAPGYDHYGLPSWLPSKIFGMLEYSSAYYNLDNFDNNMSPGGLLAIGGTHSDEEIKKIGRDLNRAYTGKGKQGRILVIGSETGMPDQDFKPFNTHKDGSFIDLIDNSIERIIASNEWDGALLGINKSGTLGKGGSYLNELYQQKVRTVIRPLHRKLKDEFLTPLCEIANEWLGTKWDVNKMDIAVTNLFDDTTEASTTVKGGEYMLKIIELVASGTYPLEAAIELVSDRFGKTREEAAKLLGNIQVRPQPIQQQPVKVEENV